MKNGIQIIKALEKYTLRARKNPDIERHTKNNEPVKKIVELPIWK